MEEPPEPLVFPHNLVKAWNDLFEKFKKEPRLTIPAGAALMGAIYLLILNLASGTCLATMFPPMIMLAVFWFFGVKRGRILLLAGLLACTAMMLVSTYFFVGVYTSLEPESAHSDDPGMILRDGELTPFEGDEMTVYNYTLVVQVNESVEIHDVKVLIIDVVYGDLRNETMLAGERNETEADYYFATTVSYTISGYVFWANVSGVWYLAATYDDGNVMTSSGPIHEDSYEIAKLMLYLSAIQSYAQFFLIYMLFVGMIWWTRRARRMREEQLKKWEAKQKETLAQTPKDEAKVPSLSRAMGLEADDSFVCSECGTDVPADATECPKCGEKFD